MALTTQQKRIIWHIKQHNGKAEDAEIVTALLKSDSQQKDMLTFLMERPTAEPMEIVDLAVALSKATM